MKWLNRLATIAAAVVIAFAVASMWEGGPLDWLFPIGAVAKTDFATLQRTPKPNQYVVCPPGLCPTTVDAESPVYGVPAERLEAAFARVAEREPRVRALAADPALRQHDYVQRSGLMRYPDIVTVRFIALDANRSTLAIYSRSIYGRSDLGVNRKRITGWLARLDAQLKAAPAAS